MSNELLPNQIIDRLTLSEDNYFQSLLEQAIGKGLLDDNDISRLQSECLLLLAHQTERFNNGDSSSIRVEKAQEIMGSIFFTVGLWLKTYPSPDKAVLALQEERIQSIYTHGRKRIQTMLAVTKVLYQKMLSELIDTPNVFYKATLADGISGFFKLYHPDYAAQEIHITTDYPLFNPIPDLKGIEFISAYVQNAFCENRFCGYFPKDCIHHLLCGYRKDYQELLINIYEQVLTAALGCIIVGSEPRRLDIRQRGMCVLEEAFTAKTKQEIFAALEAAAVKLKEQLTLSDEVYRYVGQSLRLIAGKIGRAIQDKHLQNVFYLPAYPENEPKILFSLGDKMDDESYREIVDEILECRYINDKIAIIKEKIHSLGDFDDLLSDAGWTEDEMSAVLAMLPLPEIAALSKKHGVFFENEDSDLSANEMAIRQHLRKIITELHPEQQRIVTKAISIMEEN